MQQAMSPSSLPSEQDDIPRGMSDEEELSRIGQPVGGIHGLGEVLVDQTEDLRELGLVSEGS